MLWVSISEKGVHDEEQRIAKTVLDNAWNGGHIALDGSVPYEGVFCKEPGGACCATWAKGQRAQYLLFRQPRPYHHVRVRQSWHADFNQDQVLLANYPAAQMAGPSRSTPRLGQVTFSSGPTGCAGSRQPIPAGPKNREEM